MALLVARIEWPIFRPLYPGPAMPVARAIPDEGTAKGAVPSSGLRDQKRAGGTPALHHGTLAAWAAAMAAAASSSSRSRCSLSACAARLTSPT